MPKITFSGRTQLRARPVPDGLIANAEKITVHEGTELEAVEILPETERGFVGVRLAEPLARLQSVYAPSGSFTADPEARGEKVEAVQQINEAGLKIIADYEKMPLDEAKSIAPEIEAGLSRMLAVKLTSNQFSALASWAVSVGLLTVRESQILGLVNSELFEAAGDVLERSVQTGPPGARRTLRGFEARRAAESALFKTAPEPEPEASSEPAIEPEAAAPSEPAGSNLAPGARPPAKKRNVHLPENAEVTPVA